MPELGSHGSVRGARGNRVPTAKVAIASPDFRSLTKQTLALTRQGKISYDAMVEPRSQRDVPHGLSNCSNAFPGRVTLASTISPRICGPDLGEMAE